MRFFSKQFQINFYHRVKMLMFTNGPSEEHKQALLNFERIRMYVCNFAMLAQFIQNFGMILMGKSHYQESAAFIEEDRIPYNKELAETILPYIKWVLIILTYGRLFLVAFSYKYMWLTKTYLLYTVIYYVTWNTLPNDFGVVQERLLNAWTATYFLAFSFKFWPSALLLMGTSLYIMLIVRPYMYGEEVVGGGEIVGALLWQLLILTLVQLFL